MTVEATETGSRLLESIIRIGGSEFTANLIAVAALTTAIVALVKGGTKVSNIWQEHMRSKREAVFGYYMNLDCFLKRMLSLLEDNSHGHLGTLYSLSPDLRVRTAGSGMSGLAEKLALVAQEMLQYLSVQKNQIPSGANAEERRKWRENINELVGYLNKFVLIHEGVYNPGFTSREAVDSYFNRFFVLAEKIHDRIEDETKTLLDMIESEENN